MDNVYIEKLRHQVKKALKSDKMRFRHTIGVADTCACMAMRYGIDVERAYIAGLLHDCAKCVDDEIKVSECIDNNIEMTDIERKNPYLLHSKLGAFYAKTLYGIEDEEICSAIRYHTTGRCDMTSLEKIVFLADYIEPYRNKANDLDNIRRLAFVDIDRAVYEVLKSTLDYLKKNKKKIDTASEKTFDFYDAKINGTII